MKIAQIAPITYSIPPKKYGGTERIIHALTEELVRQGHDVTLFATGDSVTSARLVSVVEKGLGDTIGKDPFALNSLTTLHYGLVYKFQDQFDIIHDHLNNISLAAANLSHTPVITTMHGPFLDELQDLFATLNRVNVVTISKKQLEMAPKGINHAGTVYHGLEMDNYPFSSTPGNYLLFVGRISKEKGVRYAIEVAKRLDMPLIIAAKLETNFKEDVDYFNKYVKPNLSEKIRWLGPVDEKTRNRLMSKAYCFLHPVTWPEPFGLVLIESLACGTPVVAMNHGAIPEIIDDGKTGFVVNSLTQMVDSVKRVKGIDRYYCRTYALEKFSAKRMAQDYLKIYNQILDKKMPYTHTPAMGNLFGKMIGNPYTASRKIVAYAHDIKHDLNLIAPQPKLALDLEK